MNPADKAQAWTTAYAIAFGLTTLGGEIRGVRDSPEDIDARARKLADQASKTIVEVVEKMEKKK
jgi:hypothetical protein